MSDNKNPWLLDGEMYQYNLGWLIDKILSFEGDLATAIDLKTIKYADPIQWDITTQYTANTVVIDPKTGVAYMSKVPVPAGVDLDNTSYWVKVFDFLSIYNRIMDGVATNERRNDYASKDYSVNDLVWYSEHLYRVTRAITEGSKFIPGTNLTETTIESCLERYYGKDRFAQVANDTLNVSGDYTVNAGDIAETADNKTVSITDDFTADIKGNANVSLGGNSVLTFSDGYAKSLKQLGADVKSYGAKGDGATDDYEAFKAAVEHTKNGDYIIVPAGTYKLSANPYPISNHISDTDPDDYSNGFRNWIIASGAKFIGAGIGDPTTGKGTFGSPFSTNPWLIVNGYNALYNLNDADKMLASNGAIVGDSKELAPITGSLDGASHAWYVLEYRGAATGNTASKSLNVELLNQVLNITGCKGIATEIDVNNYTDTDTGFSVGLFITGGGSGSSPMTALDITRDVDSKKWVNGISIKRSNTGVFADETTPVGLAKNKVIGANDAAVSGQIAKNGDGIVFKTDDEHTGSFIRCVNTDNSILFSADTNGYVKAAGYNDLTGNRLHNAVSKSFQTASKTYSNEEISIPITVPDGYSYGITAEVASIGFAASCWVTSHTDTAVTVFVNGSGTGSVKITVLFV